MFGSVWKSNGVLSQYLEDVSNRFKKFYASEEHKQKGYKKEAQMNMF